MADQPTDDLFNNNGAPPQENPPDPMAQYADLLKSIRNEQGEQKYDSLDKALEALRHSQQYIPDLKSQLSERDRKIEELMTEANKIKELEAVVERLARSQPNGEGNPPATSGIDEKAVLELVQRTLTQSREREAIEANKKRVQDELLKKFGDKAQEAIARKAAELDMTPEELGELAARKPALVLGHFQVETKPTVNQPGAGHNVPPIKKNDLDIPTPSKPLLSQGTSKEREDHMKLIREKVLAKHGISN